MTKITQATNISIPGKLEGKNAKVWKNYLLLLCEKEHIVRDELKTIKIYSWNIEEKKMQSVGLEFDMFKNQTIS